MATGRPAKHDEVPALVQSVVLDVLRRRAAGESLPDDEVIASRPDLAELFRVELGKLRQICAAADGVKKTVSVSVDEATVDMHTDPTPGVFQVRCPHCREFFQASRETPVAEIVCSVCGGHFSVADTNATMQAARPFESLGHFELIELLGVGGFGSVWKARDSKLDRTVALKIPHRGKLDIENLEKFLREARAAAQLQHPNIVRVHEVGRDQESAYIVGDFVRGIPLNDWLTDQQPTMRQAAEICATIADALQHAHDRGVVHRDLKPANILIDDDGQPHLMDFGLAKREVGEITVTLDGQVLGTPAYMSPEQAQGEAHAADGRSDIYSLGVILFELLTGELPFRGNPRMLMHQVIHDEPPSPRKFNANIPRDLETIVLKCIEKQAGCRYQTAAAVGAELRKWIHGRPIEARPLSPWAKSLRWIRKKPIAAALVVLLLALAVGGPVVAIRQARLLADLDSALQAIVKWLPNRCYTSAASAREAIRDSMEIPISIKTSPLSLCFLGELRLLAGRPDEAVTLIERAIAAGGSEPFYYKSLGWALWAEGKRQQARRAFEQAIGQEPTESADLDQLAAAYFLSKVDEAEYLEFARGRAMTGTYIAWFYIGQKLAWNGHRSSAKDAFKSAVDAAGKLENPGIVANFAAVCRDLDFLDTRVAPEE